MIEVPEEYRPVINTIYPPSNKIEFERWFYETYEGDVSDREYLPIFYTAFYVNNNYGQDKNALKKLQHFINMLDIHKKYYTIVQYDDSILNDVSSLDLIQFNMSKKFDYPLPLIGQPHPYKFNEPRKYLANFIGGLTHPIREHAKTLRNKEGYYISFDRHPIEDYCKIIAQSIFTLCYRGYGLNSFRIAEALQYGSIPVYISDDFIEAHKIPFEDYGIIIHENEIELLPKILEKNFDFRNIKRLQKSGREIYEEYYTYEGTKKHILEYLKYEVA